MKLQHIPFDIQEGRQETSSTKVGASPLRTTPEHEGAIREQLQNWNILWVHPNYSQRMLTAGQTWVLGGDADHIKAEYPESYPLILSGSAWVSRAHARIVLDSASRNPSLENLSSTNATWVDGKCIAGPTRLRHGTLLRVGDWVGLVQEDRHVEPDGPYDFGVLMEDKEHPILGGSTMKELCRRVREEKERFMGDRELDRHTKGFVYPILIQGETGTGKECVSRLLHQVLRGRSRAFVSATVNGVPDTLFEDLLFGHEENYPNSPQPKRDGLLREGRQGTLLLDDIQGLGVGSQYALLRVIQEGTFRPLGSGREEKVDLLLIATINEDPAELVAAGRLRQDLLARFQRRFCLPPLRERQEDIPGLLRHYLTEESQKRRRMKPPQIRGDLVEAILLHRAFADNVRELQRLVGELLDAAADGSDLRSWHLPELQQNDGTDSEEAIQIALVESNGNVTVASKKLRVNKKRFYETEPYKTILARYRAARQQPRDAEP